MENLNLECWYALYTKPRHEKFVETEFLKKGIEAFTPKVAFKRHWSDRIKIIEEPLFKGYCFAKFPLKNKLQILMQKGVVDIVHFFDQYIPVQDSVINSLKILVANQIKLEPYPYLKIGQRVVVRRGPLKGLEGFIVEKRNKNTRLVISIDAIGSSVQCVVDIDYVELA
ncbi:MAG: UpxY family transcription antiterminator [Candidatus Omnitrophica bacterium]|nr:UpxY family transcription antiterminator [Candidatus Omnitrophota bacterium]